MGGVGGAATKVVILFAAVVGLILQAANAASHNLVHQWCGRTEYKDLCVSIIEADRRTNLKTSPNGFCAILRDRAVADAVAASRKIPGLLKRTTNRHSIECLRDCADQYQEAITSLKSVDFSVINRETYAEMSMAASYGFRRPQECEDCFMERPGTRRPSPLTADNEKLGYISVTISAIIDLVVCNKAEPCIGYINL